MKNIAIIYWSGTGNTEKMAEAIAEAAKANGEVKLLSVDRASVDDVKNADSIALGCPAMGDEVLEESEFEPFMVELENDGCLVGKNTVIFGSYEWNEGQWMLDWDARMKEDKANMLAPGFAAYDDPDDDAIAKCKELGALL